MAEKKWDRFSANAIFLQPTWACGKNCTGCYVKEKESKFGSEEMDDSVWYELIPALTNGDKRIRSGQVTLALDTLPKTAARSKLLDIAQEYFEAIKIADQSAGSEYHLTVNTVSDLKQYDPVINDGLSLCSISHLNNADEIHTIRDFFPKAKINYNVMSGDFVKQVNAKGLDHVKSIIKNVDSVYLLLSKAPMGEVGHDFNSFFQALETLKKFKNPPQETDGQACALPDLASKFVMDGCMMDSRNFIKTGFGCSSNVSRFQIWPNGKVTGCAYNSHNQYGKHAEDLDDIIQNLYEAKDRYEFSGEGCGSGKACSIPQGLKDYSSRKVLNVVA